jgi:hypothetical protein
VTLRVDTTRVSGNAGAIQAPAIQAPKGTKVTKLTSLDSKFGPNDAKLSKEVMAALKAPGAGFPYKAFKLKLEKDKTYVIDMIRTDKTKLDPLLILQDKKLKVLAADDNGAGDLNARIVFRCPDTDTYRLLATSQPPHPVSAFRIDVYSTDAAATATIEPAP